eukprot:c27401_g1_i2 orf=496-2184(+)
MGTLVLFPQDYFASHNDRHTRFLGHTIPAHSAENGMPSIPFESAKRNSRGASSSFSSLDAIALANGAYDQSMPGNQACSPLAHLLSRSSTGTPSSTFVGVSSPRRGYTDVFSQSVPAVSEGSFATYNTKSQFLSSRSLSADLSKSNSARCGNKVSVVERPYSSTGRHSSIPVGGSGVGLPENGRVSKFADPKSLRRGSGFDDLPRKHVGFGRALNSRDVVGDLRKRTQADFVPRKGVVEGDSTSLQKKHGDVRKGGKRWSEKIAAGQTSYDTETEPNTSIAPPLPVVTILRRPKTREAAQELLEKFKWKTEFASSVNLDVCEGDPAFPSLKSTDNLMRSYSDTGTLGENINDSLEWHLTKPSTLAFAERPFLRSNQAVDDGEMESIKGDCGQKDKARSTPACKTDISSSAAPAFKGGNTLRRDRKGGHGTLGSGQNKALHGVSSGAVTTSFKSEAVLEDDHTFVPSLSSATDERWAGPAYTNSPPPSSLPLPTFSLKQLRSSFAELPASGEQLMDNWGSLGRGGPPSFPTVACGSGLTTFGGAIDVAFATKDLRRLLNLDSC